MNNFSSTLFSRTVSPVSRSVVEKSNPLWLNQSCIQLLKYWMLTITFVVLLIPGALGQNAGKGNGFRFYIFPGFYSASTKQDLLQKNYDTVRVIMQAFIDNDKDSKINPDAVGRFCDKFYPEVNAGGLCIVDWEAQPFNDLRQYDKNDDRFKAAASTYIELVKLIKKLRPNIKVGIYGLPFRFYNPTQRLVNSQDKYEEVLAACDVIAPSLYIYYTDEQVGQEKNLQYIRDNAEEALKYGKKLGKPVLPFFWYRVHPGNKKFGMQPISKNEMQAYLKCLAGYSYQGVKISGVIWWEGTDKTPAKDKNQFSAQDMRIIPQVNRDSVLVNYTSPFSNNRK